MDLATFYQHAEADHALVQCLRSLDQGLVGAYGATLTTLFREIVAQEHKDPKQFEALKQAYAATARGAMRYLDDKGVTAHVARHAPELKDVSFAHSAPLLAYEAACLFRLGVPHDKIKPFWTWLDHHKAATAQMMSKPDFRLEPLVDPVVSSFGKETGGEPWEHLSPGFWRRMGGFALAVANLVAEIPTAGLATVSVVVGAAGVAAG
jgi:hypothetical protein